MRFPLAVGILVAGSLTACGGGDASDVGGSGGASSGGGAGGPSGGGTGAAAAAGAAGSSAGSGGATSGSPTFVEDFSVDIGPITVSPGEERTECVVKRLGNPAEIRVGRVHNVISSSSHHMIVYRSSDTAERLDPFECTPFLETLDPSKGAPLLVTQRKDDELVLPRGAAFVLEPNQMIRLELHYINTQADAVDVAATATFSTIADADFEHAADFMFLGSPDIRIPPHSTWSLTRFLTLPPELSGKSFFAVTGHTHQYGTNVTIAAAPGPGVPGTTVYDVDGWRWDEPETVIHDPPFEVPGGGGFDFTCEWNNTSDRTVDFGESFYQEMCFFWAYYFPSDGARVCLRSNQYLGGVDACCPGNPLCGLVGSLIGP